MTYFGAPGVRAPFAGLIDPSFDEDFTFDVIKEVIENGVLHMETAYKSTGSSASADPRHYYGAPIERSRREEPQSDTKLEGSMTELKEPVRELTVQVSMSCEDCAAVDEAYEERAKTLAKDRPPGPSPSKQILTRLMRQARGHIPDDKEAVQEVMNVEVADDGGITLTIRFSDIKDSVATPFQFGRLAEDKAKMDRGIR